MYQMHIISKRTTFFLGSFSSVGTYLTELALSQFLNRGEVLARKLGQVELVLPQQLHVARHAVVTSTGEALQRQALGVHGARVGRGCVTRLVVSGEDTGTEAERFWRDDWRGWRERARGRQWRRRERTAGDVGNGVIS